MVRSYCGDRREAQRDGRSLPPASCSAATRAPSRSPIFRAMPDCGFSSSMSAPRTRPRQARSDRAGNGPAEPALARPPRAGGDRGHAALGQADRSLHQPAGISIGGGRQRRRCRGDDGPLHGPRPRSRQLRASPRHLGRLWRALGIADRVPLPGHEPPRLGPAFPLLGTNGVRTGADVARMALAGATRSR